MKTENEKTQPIRRYSMFPKSVAKSIEPLLKPIYKKHGFAESRILTEWESIVGRELAAFSIPQKLTLRTRNYASRGYTEESHKKSDSGTLHILVASGRALELQHMQPVIIDKIATYFGYMAVNKITFMQTSSAIFRKKTVEKQREKQPVSETLTALIAECGDDELRKALLSLGSVIQTASDSAD